MRIKEPEREMVRRALPFLLIGIGIAFASGTAVAGVDAGISAGIGAIVVLVNFAANGYSLSWAARTSATFLGAVAAIGFFLRMSVIFGAVFLLRDLSFFSTRAFILAVVPLTLVLLAYEMKIVAGPMGRELDVADRNLGR